MEIEIKPDQGNTLKAFLEFQQRKKMKRTATTPKAKKTGQKKIRQDNFGIYKPIGKIKPELKWKDTQTPTGVPPFGTWITPNLINGLQVGGSPTQRVGRKVNFTKLLVRGLFTASSVTPPDTDTNIRIMVFADRQANGSTPLVLDVVTSDEFNAPMNLDNRDRFVILADIVIEQCVGITNQAVQFTINRKFNIETVFNANGNGTAGDISTNSIWIMYCGSHNNFSQPLGAQVRSRLRFIDM